MDVRQQFLNELELQVAAELKNNPPNSSPVAGNIAVIHNEERGVI